MKNRSLKFITFIAAAALLVTPVFQGCQKTPSGPPVKAEKPGRKAAKPLAPQAQQAETAALEPETEEGYIYQPGDRRDPFVPLIVPSRKSEARDSRPARLGTLESYDISEFALLAIAKKGEKYYALLITPDNRSFTVSKGTGIGLNKGRVEEITGNKVVFVEYSKDFRGDSRPKQITLELKER